MHISLLLALLLQQVANPERIAESVTVTPPGAARVPVTATATVLTAESLVLSPSFTLDQKLLSTPGFSLFRRSSSRTANPTTQGVTLRGLSASGASRTLVMADDLPLNDPFGGWVYWNRVPAASIDRVEVARGGTSDLFGSDALGGAIRVITRRDRAAELRAEAGNQETARVSGYGGVNGGTSASAGIEWSTTEGYIPVEPAARGAVDTPAGSDYLSVIASASRAAGHVRIDAGGSYLDEDRTNGTVLQTNATRGGAGNAGASGAAGGGSWRARFHAAYQEYDQTFSAVGAGRATERLTGVQHVESKSQRADVSWARGGARVSWLFDAAYRHIEADLIDSGVLTPAVQHAAGAGGQIVWNAAARWTISGGVRGEHWRSSNSADASADSSVFLVAPRANVSWRASDSTVVRASVFNAFRTPTVNELFRSFRVGDIVTQPDSQLEPEEGWGGETAVTFTRGRFTARGVLFATWLDGAIYSRTLPRLPQDTVTTRIRSNGDARAIGAEVEIDGRVRDWLAGWVSVTAGSSEFTGGQLEGNRLPQVPPAQAAAGARIMHGRWLAALEARYWGRQFDDDRNTFELKSAAAANAMAAIRFAHAHLFASIENIFDAEIDAGRTPLRTLAQPRTWQLGMRVFTR